MQQYVFLSLVGDPRKNEALFGALKRKITERYPTYNPVFFDDPFANWDRLKIGDREKISYPPASRVCFRWGLFFDFNEKHVQTAIANEAKILFTIQYGFDLCDGANAFQDSGRALSIHLSMVAHGVRGLGISPPYYLFTEAPSSEMQEKIRRYFDPAHGQNEPVYVPASKNLFGQVSHILRFIDGMLDNSSIRKIA